MSPEEIQHLSHLITDIAISFAPIVGIYFIRSFVDAFIAGLIWKVGRKYNENDVVVIDGDEFRCIVFGQGIQEGALELGV